ncbi:MAG: ParA family protein [Nostoc sp.]
MTLADNSRILRKKLNPLRQEFAHILIDCPPSLGMLTLNALMQQMQSIPFQMSVFCFIGYDGLETIQSLRDEDTHPNLQILGVLPTMADRTLTTQDALKTLKTKLPGVKFLNQFLVCSVSRVQLGASTNSSIYHRKKID